MKKRISTICLIIMLTILVGCGKDKVDYVTEAKNSEDSNTDISLTNLKDKLEVEDYWEETVDSTKGKKVEAYVSVPDVTGMKVVTATQKFYGPEDREKLLNAITDSAIYKYDYEFLPKGDKFTTLEEYRAKLEEKESSGVYNETTYSYYDNGGYVVAEEDEEKDYELLAEYEKDYAAAPDSLVVADDYEGNIYRFARNDLEFVMTFYDYEYEAEKYCIPFDSDEETLERFKYEYADLQTIEMTLFDSKDMLGDDSYQSIEMNLQNIKPDAENKCIISVEDAQTMAEAMVEDMDVGDFKMVKTYPLHLSCVIDEYNSDSVYNGYVFYFYRQIDGVSVDGNMYEYLDSVRAQQLCMEEYISIHYTEEEYNERMENDSIGFGTGLFPACCFEEIIICVNDNGIIYMKYNAPKEITSVLAEDVNMVSFEGIKGSVKDEMLASDVYDYRTFRYMELTYFPLRNEDDINSYSIVPAWRLSSTEPTDANDYIVINAMDGSMIDVGAHRWNILYFEEVAYEP